jgi:preprotein translocase subunit YajC
MALLIPFFILAAFFLLRANPQRRRVQAQKAMIETLRPGAHVVTVAGVIGTVVGVEGDRVAIEIAPGVIVEFLLAAVVRTVDEPVAPDDDDVVASHDEDPPHDGLEPDSPAAAPPDAHEPPAPRHEEI